MKTVLHIINSSKTSELFSENTVEMIATTDAILFIENGIYRAVSSAQNQALLGQQQAPIYVLLPDLKARGFDQQELLDNVNAVDYEGFVDLTARYDTSVSW